MRASAIGSLRWASSSMRSTRRRSAPGWRTSTRPGRTSWGRSAGRSWRRRLGNWGRTPSAHCAACAAVALLGALALRPAGAAEADCRDLVQRYDVAKAGITSVQLNAILFAAAAKDCGALARRVIAAGASLRARDRVGAMPLAHAARGGHVALVERFLADGAPIDARDLNGATALHAAAEAE